MEQRVMTDEQVIKALECCTKKYGCCDCPLENDELCMITINKEALSLIKRQQAVIERLQEIANPKCQQCVEQTRKNGIVEFANELQRRMFYWTKDFKNNSECIAAEREVDDLVKEMTEGNA